jgi:hypothetical protein
MHAVGHTVRVVCPDKKAGEVLRRGLDQDPPHDTKHRNIILDIDIGLVESSPQ